TAPHMALTELDAPYAALQLIRKWGPLRLSDADFGDDGIGIQLHAYAWSHHRQIKSSPDRRLTFTTDARDLFLQQREVRELMHLWIARRDEKLDRLRDLFKARIAEPLPVYDDEPPEGYDDYVHQRELISATLSTGNHEAVLNLAVLLIKDHFDRHMQLSW